MRARIVCASLIVGIVGLCAPAASIQTAFPTSSGQALSTSSGQALSTGSGQALSTGSGQAPQGDPARAERLAWFHQAKYGLFIHWGLYAIPAGEWKGKRIPGIGE